MKIVHQNSSMPHTGRPTILVVGAVALAVMFAGLTALSDSIQANTIRQVTGAPQR